MVLAVIAEMFPHSQTAKKIDGNSHDSYESLVVTWEKALDGLSDHQINQGMVNLLNSGNRFEPSLPEFMAMCRGGAKAYHKPYQSLPRPAQDGRIREYETAKIRFILGKHQ
jgi:hypothetical protein